MKTITWSNELYKIIRNLKVTDKEKRNSIISELKLSKKEKDAVKNALNEDKKKEVFPW
ncbi:hypothetical protein [Chengkuizengella axinellae]|uniref:Uncharacterized protein n=1 Tax=Chengkuizengella axinellae TaxID=3064388 RepID=A0ABT9J5B3_9BACL|nr:hypothetical protein [Chengkuizengella sp. 2205SS18-9]MDP5276801.1 hypothetical protein [Chengkuizengella sp. 2205SS18-9]